MKKLINIKYERERVVDASVCVSVCMSVCVCVCVLLHVCVGDLQVGKPFEVLPGSQETARVSLASSDDQIHFSHNAFPLNM